MCGVLGVKLANICKDVGTSGLVSLFDSTEPELKGESERIERRKGRKREEEKMEGRRRAGTSDKQIKSKPRR